MLRFSSALFLGLIILAGLNGFKEKEADISLVSKIRTYEMIFCANANLRERSVSANLLMVLPG